MKRVVMTVLLPCDMRAMVAVLRALSDEYPDATIKSEGVRVMILVGDDE